MRSSVYFAHQAELLEVITVDFFDLTGIEFPVQRFGWIYTFRIVCLSIADIAHENLMLHLSPPLISLINADFCFENL